MSFDVSFLELSPIEQYAVKFMEKLRENLDTEALVAAEEDITIAKEEWELTHMQVHKYRLSPGENAQGTERAMIRVLVITITPGVQQCVHMCMRLSS